MENDPGNHLQLALMRDINGLLEHEGMVLPDREIILSPEDVAELDVIDIVVGRNDKYARAVCHLHRPSTDEFYWRHDTFVAWDDGRSANFQVNIALNDNEQAVMQALPATRQALKNELNRLVHHDVLEPAAAQAMEHMILVEMTHVRDEVHEALSKQDELGGDEGDAIRVMKSILESIDTHLTLNREPHSDFNQLYTIIRRLRLAQFEAMALRERISERYLKLSDRYMDTAEADPTSTADPAAAWSLLELLDKIR